MTGAQIQFISTGSVALTDRENAPLREGSIVSVRVLKDLGGGRYTVFFGGTRCNVSSRTPLKAGDIFQASVALDKNGTVILKAQNEGAESVRQAENSFITLLKNLSLAPDGVNLKLLGFIQQTGLRLDRSLIARARMIASRFPGKEKAAAEAALMLLEKGIDPDEVLVEGLISAGEREGSHEGSQKGSSPEKNEGEGTFLSRLYASSLPRKGGLLTLVNHMKNAGDKHWVILPFEWETGKGTAKGKIRILTDIRRRETEKIVISCKFSVTNYYFVVYYNKSTVKEVRFCTLPALLTDKILPSEKSLGELFSSGMNPGSSVSVIYSTSALTDGLCCNDEAPLSFDERL